MRAGTVVRTREREEGVRGSAEFLLITAELAYDCYCPAADDHDHADDDHDDDEAMKGAGSERQCK